MKRLWMGLTLAILVGAGSLCGQNFTYNALDRQLPGQAGMLTQFYSDIFNLTDQEMTFVVMMETNVPSGWNANFCVGITCYPPFVDSVTAVIPAGGMDSVLVDVTPDESGLEGRVIITVYPLDNPDQAITIEFLVFDPLGQIFTYNSRETQLPGEPGQLTQFYSELQNLSAGEVSFVVLMDTEAPPGWVINFCVGTTCYPPFVDSVTVPIAGNQFDSVLVDVNPDESGSEGHITMTIYPENAPQSAISIVFYAFVPLGIADRPSSPANYSLLQAYPNPFNSSVRLDFGLSVPITGELSIFDLSGRKVSQLFVGELAPGNHQFTWQPQDCASGLYLARLVSPQGRQIKKILYLR